MSDDGNVYIRNDKALANEVNRLREDYDTKISDLTAKYNTLLAEVTNLQNMYVAVIVDRGSGPTA